ncbi:PKD domain-containing protein [uncultured Hymenobacter sp.]|uniref:PKD domain-containing protein n=1 Tax=uncultured Hymenobacter sp. TaxID=170016 RepID=UPI0035CBBEFF
MHDGDELLLSANTSGRPDLEYSWDFGDGTKTSYSTSYSTTHRFNTGAQDRTYQVRLLIRIPAQMQEFSGTQDVLITKKPLVLTSCTAGVVAVDDCKVESPSVSTSCNPSAPTNSTAFSVLTNLPGTYTYVWEKAQPMGGYTTWETISGATSSSYVVTFIYGVGQYRCTVTGGGQVGVSEVFSIEHYSSSKDIQYPCTPK